MLVKWLFFNKIWQYLTLIKLLSSSMISISSILNEFYNCIDFSEVWKSIVLDLPIHQDSRCTTEYKISYLNECAHYSALHLINWCNLIHRAYFTQKLKIYFAHKFWSPCPYYGFHLKELHDLENFQYRFNFVIVLYNLQKKNA